MIDEIIETIKKSNTKADAKEQLMSKFEFSDAQAEYILLMRLQSLVGLEIQKIIDEIDEKRKKIEYLEGEIETLRDEARRKDEELKRLGADVRVARDRVERARRARAIDADADELCRRLEELGHGCEK